MMELKGTIVALDALGCQKGIAKKLIEGGGDFTFAIKDNRPKLAADIEQALRGSYESGLLESGF